MGNIHPSLANLDQLQVLRLDRNWFNGSLPKEFAYGFPNLVEMRLDFNSLTVSSGRWDCQPGLDMTAVCTTLCFSPECGRRANFGCCWCPTSLNAVSAIAGNYSIRVGIGWGVP